MGMINGITFSIIVKSSQRAALVKYLEKLKPYIQRIKEEIWAGGIKFTVSLEWLPQEAIIQSIESIFPGIKKALKVSENNTEDTASRTGILRQKRYYIADGKFVPLSLIKKMYPDCTVLPCSTRVHIQDSGLIDLYDARGQAIAICVQPNAIVSLLPGQ